MPQGSVTSMRSTLSGVDWDVLRDLPVSVTLVWDEEGVGRLVREVVLLGPGWLWSVLIGGNDGEKSEGGRALGRVCEGGIRWIFR